MAQQSALTPYKLQGGGSTDKLEGGINPASPTSPIDPALLGAASPDILAWARSASRFQPAEEPIMQRLMQQMENPPAGLGELPSRFNAPGFVPVDQSGYRSPANRGGFPAEASLQGGVGTDTLVGSNYATRANFGNPRSAGWAAQNLVTVYAPNGVPFQVNRESAPAFRGFVNELAATGYMIRPEDSGGYDLRNKRGGVGLSQHAFGNAIDINWTTNTFAKNPSTDMPENVRDIATKWGVEWGMDWKGKKDAMHFEWTGVPVVAGVGALRTKEDVAAAQRVLADRGLYTGKVDGEAGPLTKKALANYAEAVAPPPPPAATAVASEGPPEGTVRSLFGRGDLPLRNPIDLSPHDRDAAIRTIIGEAGGESEAGQTAVAQVIANRYDQGHGKSVAAISTDPKAFNAWNGDLVTAYNPGDPLYDSVGKIVDAVFTTRPPPPPEVGNATEFYSGGKQPGYWKGKVEQIGQIGGHVFGAIKGALTQPQGFTLRPSRGNVPDPRHVALQTQLAQAGLYKGRIDGKYGPQTQRAVSAWQQAHSLRPTGIADATTLQSLKLPTSPEGFDKLLAVNPETPANRSVLFPEKQTPGELIAGATAAPVAARLAPTAGRPDTPVGKLPAGRQPYETILTPAEEKQYQTWKAKNAPNDSGADYDLRGAFKAGLTPSPENGHWPDTFKKPNHPTFSDESIYAKARPDLAGHWDGDTYVPPAKTKIAGRPDAPVGRPPASTVPQAPSEPRANHSRAVVSALPVAAGGQEITQVIVRKGDTLSAISKRAYGTSTRWKEIAEANAISDRETRTLKPGRVLDVPGPSSLTGIPTPKARPEPPAYPAAAMANLPGEVAPPPPSYDALSGDKTGERQRIVTRTGDKELGPAVGFDRTDWQIRQEMAEMDRERNILRASREPSDTGRTLPRTPAPAGEPKPAGAMVKQSLPTTLDQVRGLPSFLDTAEFPLAGAPELQGKDDNPVTRWMQSEIYAPGSIFGTEVVDGQSPNSLSLDAMREQFPGIDRTRFAGRPDNIGTTIPPDQRVTTPVAVSRLPTGSAAVGITKVPVEGSYEQPSGAGMTDDRPRAQPPVAALPGSFAPDFSEADGGPSIIMDLPAAAARRNAPPSRRAVDAINEMVGVKPASALPAGATPYDDDYGLISSGSLINLAAPLSGGRATSSDMTIPAVKARAVAPAAPAEQPADELTPANGTDIVANMAAARLAQAQQASANQPFAQPAGGQASAASGQPVTAMRSGTETTPPARTGPGIFQPGSITGRTSSGRPYNVGSYTTHGGYTRSAIQGPGYTAYEQEDGTYSYSYP